MKKEMLILFYGDIDRGLLSRAAELSVKSDRTVHAVLICGNYSATQEMVRDMFLYGADEVSLATVPDSFVDEAALSCKLAALVDTVWEADTVLSPATVRMRSIMPMIAAELHVGLTADCTGLNVGSRGDLIQVRPAFGNRLMAEIRTESKVTMATVRENVFVPVRYEKPEHPVSFYEMTSNDLKPRVEQLSFTPMEKGTRLSEAKIIFAGGAGIGSRENFGILAEAARKCGAALGASRMAVELGYVSYAHQIGQTGLVVRPELYVCFGISGAVQHLLGMGNSGRIIAVNTDKKAPVFDYADEGIYGDWKEVIEKIRAKI